MWNDPADWTAPWPRELRGGAVAIGNFDGAHTGHAALVRELLAAGRPAVAVTFDPHPRALLRPGAPLTLLTTSADRAEGLRRLGADHVVTLRTTPELLDLRAAEFFDQIVLGRLGAAAMAEGTNFCFGRGREGDIALLAKLCAASGIRLTVVHPVLVAGAEVSSSRVRVAVEAGDVSLAAALLGRPYLMRGTVVGGDRRGRTIGFPTANLERVPTVVPGDGVYAVRVALPDGTAHAGAANLGPNPTFAERRTKIEVHLIGFAGDLYGRELRVEFVARLRETRRFAGPAELVERLRRDVEQARAALGLADFSDGAGRKGFPGGGGDGKL